MTATESPTTRYKLLAPDLDADTLEQEMLARWEAEDLVAQTLARGDEEFVFFEGPPTANGRPGIHHVFSRTIKDLFCRHRAMKGFHVGRKAGWDTHGLPVEIEIEKALGISGKRDIEALGVEAFNKLCRESVWKYKGEWEQLSARIGYWLDYSDPYVTYSNNYVESVWWALATLHRSKLLVRGHKILPYCPRCETTLSSHEVAQGYQDVEDPSVYLSLELTTPGGLAHRRAHPRVDDHAVDARVERRARGASDAAVRGARAPRAQRADGDPRRGARARGAGRGLRGSMGRGARVDGRRAVEAALSPPARLAAVSCGRGARGDRRRGLRECGRRNRRRAHGAGVRRGRLSGGKRHGLAFLQPVNGRGEFPASLPVVGGLHVKKADPAIIVVLEERGVLWKAGTLVHSYPHCWRCGTPLLYYARESWFVSTTSFKDRMMARNARVELASAGSGRGQIRRVAREQRRLGAVARSLLGNAAADLGVRRGQRTRGRDRLVRGARGAYGEATAGRLRSAQAVHRRVHVRVRSRVGCGGTMKRVPEVIDTWFDSGSMPFAQWHYPFENKDDAREAVPRGVHRGGRGPDARMVLLVARDRDGTR